LRVDCASWNVQRASAKLTYAPQLRQQLLIKLLACGLLGNITATGRNKISKKKMGLQK
jgi:hypothetical protein